MFQTGFYVMLLDSDKQTWGVVWTLIRDGRVSNHCVKFNSYKEAISCYPFARRIGA